MKCVWCGSPGGYVNRLVVSGSDEDAIAECEWCFSTNEYRTRGARGAGN